MYNKIINPSKISKQSPNVPFRFVKRYTMMCLHIRGSATFIASFKSRKDRKNAFGHRLASSKVFCTSGATGGVANGNVQLFAFFPEKRSIIYACIACVCVCVPVCVRHLCANVFRLTFTLVYPFSWMFNYYSLEAFYLFSLQFCVWNFCSVFRGNRTRERNIPK